MDFTPSHPCGREERLEGSVLGLAPPALSEKVPESPQKRAALLSLV
jgi:hypothetical protein